MGSAAGRRCPRPARARTKRSGAGAAARWCETWRGSCGSSASVGARTFYVGGRGIRMMCQPDRAKKSHWRTREGAPMPDMLVKLYELPPVQAEIESFRRRGIVVRRARPYEITPVRQFVEKHFALTWADETS